MNIKFFGTFFEEDRVNVTYRSSNFSVLCKVYKIENNNIFLPKRKGKFTFESVVHFKEKTPIVK